MKNTIRCCISCILPCGALDVIRIVHSNGRVEEISGTVRAAEVMKAYPKHVLKKPSSSSYPAAESIRPKIVIVPPDAELQRGKIYFLMLAPSPPEKAAMCKPPTQKMNKKKKKNNTEKYVSVTNLVGSDWYLTEILSEKISTQRDRRRGRAAVWRPHLESISETPNEV